MYDHLFKQGSHYAGSLSKKTSVFLFLLAQASVPSFPYISIGTKKNGYPANLFSRPRTREMYDIYNKAGGNLSAKIMSGETFKRGSRN